MSYLLDDVARSLAKPMPRRRALKQLGGLFLGSLAAAWLPSRASAQTDAASCHPRCRPGSHCCTGGRTPFCAPDARTCCGDTACTAAQHCCGTICCADGRECCGLNEHLAVCCGRGLSCNHGRCAASRG